MDAIAEVVDGFFEPGISFQRDGGLYVGEIGDEGLFAEEERGAERREHVDHFAMHDFVNALKARNHEHDQALIGIFSFADDDVAHQAGVVFGIPRFEVAFLHQLATGFEDLRGFVAEEKACLQIEKTRLTRSCWPSSRKW